jgi:hypothetical protein
MTDIKIRGLPEWVIERQKRLAENQGQSLNQRLRTLVENDAQRVKGDFLAKVQQEYAKAKQEGTLLPEGTVVQMLREDREAR